jgi:hypothetical protein
LLRVSSNALPNQFCLSANGYIGAMDADFRQQVSMLRILHAACSTALDAFHAADNPIDVQLVADLEKMVERTRLELERLVNPSAGAASGEPVAGS